MRLGRNTLVRVCQYKLNNNKTMERIIEQINGILTYTSSDLEGLKEEYQELGMRINEGLSKMKAAAVFTDAEIREAGEYARQLLLDKFEIARQAIVDSVRDSFEF